MDQSVRKVHFYSILTLAESMLKAESMFLIVMATETVTGPIQLSQHLDDLKHDGASPITITNYTNYLRTVGISEVDPSNVDAIWTSLRSKLDAGVSYGAIAGALKVIRKALKEHGHAFVKTYDYNRLVKDLAKKGSKPEAYTLDQLKQILYATQVMGTNSNPVDYSLFKICLLCIYSGLRISSIEGLKLDAFKKVERYPVYAFPVFSKQVPYTAIIAAHAYDLIRNTTPDPTQPIVKSNPGSSTFDKYYRSKMVYLLIRYGIAPTMAKQKPFHSMRKFFAEQLAKTPDLHSEDIAALMGHRPPRTTAYRHYISDMQPAEKLASLYCRTPLVSLKLIGGD